MRTSKPATLLETQEFRSLTFTRASVLRQRRRSHASVAVVGSRSVSARQSEFGRPV
jgi:hypothetical protein